ncbi:L-fuculokinase [Yersinia kristensenii]|uniref:L-fuculokinase n=1 Tax=Yersinia kristensenii TaxID=28152 RepID=UPI0005E0B569|nr:L-fuculokinase [Yersinia kristensenii]MDA5475006.1 L-fuculokinase [Yersinia kristensenii]MDA5478622.1 L-fuculokinase [Yersinia kristensenii]MDA5506491.1 L-fuculokinase [Yersinia kristensenii]MDA5524273.1 L-fuculokinase [Yersinia kristensenii]MDR4897777.1 L-fuculokinase [Yersinia kristensenii]
MKRDVVIVLDCGATNIRAIAVDPQGVVVAKAVLPNHSQPDSVNPQWQLWPLEGILHSFAQCCRQLLPQIHQCKIHALTVTTFGVDGALVDASGNMLYPIISWKCPRTIAIMEDISRYMSAEKLQQISGIGQFSFNTLYKLIWLQENKPDLVEQAHAWLFISSLINQRLTGEFTTDRTMAGTSQLLDVKREQFSDAILQKIGIQADLFPPMVAAGEIIGQLLPSIAADLGLPAGLPVISAGHDTQFALFGSGADLDQPVLSSGTWEILMVRTPNVNTALLPQFTGSTCELDSCSRLFNPGLQWLASGVLEWVRKLYWHDDACADIYRQMIAEATAIAPGANGMRMDCNLLGSAGHHLSGGWQGVSLSSGRGHFYRSALESLAWQLKDNLAVLERIGEFRTRELLLVGGGSRNMLWNQIKADVLNLPVKVIDESETTVLGAALFAWHATGYYASAEQARAQVNYRYQYYYPGEQQPLYQSLNASPAPLAATIPLTGECHA